MVKWPKLRCIFLAFFFFLSDTGAKPTLIRELTFWMLLRYRWRCDSLTIRLNQLFQMGSDTLKTRWRYFHDW